MLCIMKTIEPTLIKQDQILLQGFRVELTIIAQRIDKNFAESKFGLNHRRQNKSNCGRTPYINIRILFAAVDAIIFVLYCFFPFFFLWGGRGRNIDFIQKASRPRGWWTSVPKKHLA